jgi:hypothetical protein
VFPFVLAAEQQFESLQFLIEFFQRLNREGYSKTENIFIFKMIDKKNNITSETEIILTEFLLGNMKYDFRSFNIFIFTCFVQFSVIIRTIHQL